MAIDGEKMIPPNISDTGKFDEDSNLRLFRGMMTPWDKIKSFKETYEFLIRHASLYGTNLVSCLRIIEPDYEKRVTAMSSEWGKSLREMWYTDDMGLYPDFRDRFAVPPFVKGTMYKPASYADKGDEMMLMPGYIWSASTDRVEKEVHRCDFDIVGPEACDVSNGGGQYFCRGIARTPMNNYLLQRKGCGDPVCRVVFEAKDKYGEIRNGEGYDGYDWEMWGVPASGTVQKNMPNKKECEFLTTGSYTSPLGATWTAGQMYQDCAMWPMAYAFTSIDAIRVLVKDEDMPKAQHVINTIYENAGKMMFGEWNTRKATREWLGVPESVEDGRVLGGYMSMIFQARNLQWKFLEFSEEQTIIECDRVGLEMVGMYPEFTPAYLAYFQGMVKTLVNSMWIVELDEDAPYEVVRFVIKKGLIGFRRQKPDYRFTEKDEDIDFNLMSKDESVIAQHNAVRNSVGWYDFTHHLVEVTGDDATIFLDKLYSNSIAKAKIGGAKYTTMLNEEGIILDDVIIFRLEENKYWVSTLYIERLLQWYDDHKEDNNVSYQRITEEWKMYSVQGPKAKDLVNAVADESIEDLKFFNIRDNKIDGIPVKIARGGFTGEKWGYEIYFAVDQEETVAAKLSKEGTALGGKLVTEVDVKALTLSGEKGFVLMIDIGETNPFEVGFENMIDWEKDFIGKSALLKVKEEGPKRLLLGFTLDDKDASIYGGPHGAYVKKGEELIGRVTKFIWGATVGKFVGYALIDTDKAAVGDTVQINGYEVILTERQILK